MCRLTSHEMIKGSTQMSSIDRPMHGDVLLFDLGHERRLTTDQDRIERSGRNARTLLKEDALRVTLIVVGAGGEIPEHQASGPIVVQVLEGAIAFTAAGVTHDLAAGQLLSLKAGIRHSVRSAAGGTFLLTVCQV